MVGKALETICGFANADGGMLVLGVADLKEHQGRARLFGTDENPEAVDELQRKLLTEFQPAIESIRLRRLTCPLHNGPSKGQTGHVLLVQVGRSDKVHSVVNGGTYTRLEAGNRQMSASEVTELAYRRGVRSAASEPVPVALERLQTDAWRRFVASRGLRTGSFAEHLLRVGLAEDVHGAIQPTRAAVLLFADEPGNLLAAHDTRADVRLNVAAPRAEEAFLAFGNPSRGATGPTLNLSPAGDLGEAAANLFAMLRALDAGGARVIAVAPIPARGLGLAINDRLRRAAAPRS